MGGEMYTAVFNGGAVEIKVGSGEAILSKRGWEEYLGEINVRAINAQRSSSRGWQKVWE